MIDLYLVDHLSSNGNSFLHNANVITKLISIIILIPLLITANSSIFYISLLIFLFFVSYFIHLPTQKIMHWIAYPLFFTSFFSLSLYFGKNLDLAITVMLRSASICCIMLILVCTTQLTSLFSAVSIFAGETMTSIFFVTYRYFFVIFDILDNYLLAFKVRGGGLKSIFSKNSPIFSIFGVMFIYALDNLEMLEKVMVVRGFKGHFSRSVSTNFDKNDLLVALGLFLILTMYLVVSWM